MRLRRAMIIPRTKQTYRNFLTLAKGILVVVIIILIGMATFLTGS